jgi:hypothetical protein
MYEAAETVGGAGPVGAAGGADGSGGAVSVAGAGAASVGAARDTAGVRRMLPAGVAAVWLFPFVQLRVAADSGLFGISTLLSAFIAGAAVGQAFLLVQRRRMDDGEPVGYAAFAAGSVAAALASGALASFLYQFGQVVPWALLGLVFVFWLAARLLDRGRRIGYPLALAGCAVLFGLLPYAADAHAPLTGTAPGAYGTLAAVAALALVGARRKDAWLEHLERLRAAEVRELAPGQEPDGPQDAVPAEFLAAQAARDRARAVAVEARRDRPGAAAPSIVLVGDLILVLLGFRGVRAIGIPVNPGTLLGSQDTAQSFHAVLLAGGLCVGLFALTVVAARGRRFGLVALQCCLLLCTLLLGISLAVYAGSRPGMSTPPTNPYNGNQGPVATQTGGAGGNGSVVGGCSGGACYGKDAQGS